VFFAPAETD
jgi:L-amino acid N-acyltransferase YncA